MTYGVTFSGLKSIISKWETLKPKVTNPELMILSLLRKYPIMV